MSVTDEIIMPANGSEGITDEQTADQLFQRILRAGGLTVQLGSTDELVPYKEAHNLPMYLMLSQLGDHAREVSVVVRSAPEDPTVLLAHVTPKISAK